MKLAMAIVMCAAVGMGQTAKGIVWSPDGTYACLPMGATCLLPTKKEVAAHKPKPAPKPILGDEAQGYQVVKPPQPMGTGNISPITPVGTMEWKPCAFNLVNPPCPGPLTATGIPKNFVMSMTSATGRIDRLSDEEYARLQVTPVKDYEAEKRKVALAHGVDMGPSTTAQAWWIHGQWLGVNTGFMPQGVGR